MKKTVTAAIALAGVAAALPAAPARAAGTMTMSSPACGQLTTTNSMGVAMDYVLDDSYAAEVAANSSATVKSVPSGVYTWQATSVDGSTNVFGVVTVKACSTNPVRPTAGDFDGDHISDVLGITASTGYLYAYHTASTGLASLGQVGSGWGTTVWFQRVSDWTGSGTWNKLLAIRSDGSLWSYDDNGKGKLSNAKQLGTGFQNYKNYAVISTNNKLGLGMNILVASQGDAVTGWMFAGDGLVEVPMGGGWSTVSRAIALRDFDGDAFADLITIRTDGSMWVQTTTANQSAPLTAPRQIGSGWGAMQTVASPGTLNADGRSDLIARRADGNLYRYLSQGSYWAPYVKIGQNWQAVRLLG